MLSVIIPVYDEVATLPLVLAMASAALPMVEKEIIIVDDGSRDGTREWLRTNFPTGARNGTCITVGADGDLELEHVVRELGELPGARQRGAPHDRRGPRFLVALLGV